MNTNEVLKLALEALEGSTDKTLSIRAITALREALAQPQQEPLAFADTSPPARKPLTNEEMEKIAAEYWLYPRKFVRAIEAAHGIKENT